MDVTCNNCGRVHFGISRDEAEEAVDDFNKMYEDLTPAEQHRYYSTGAVTIEQYEKCIRCGNTHEDFRLAKENDCPRGVTTSAIIID